MISEEDNTFTAQLYKEIPCMIGYFYARFNVDGSVQACCSSPKKMGNITKEEFGEIWHSDAYYVWRSKFLQINQTHFHLDDPEFAYCKMCPHYIINIERHKLVTEPRK